MSSLSGHHRLNSSAIDLISSPNGNIDAPFNITVQGQTSALFVSQNLTLDFASYFETNLNETLASQVRIPIVLAAADSKIIYFGIENSTVMLLENDGSMSVADSKCNVTYKPFYSVKCSAK